MSDLHILVWKLNLIILSGLYPINALLWYVIVLNLIYVLPGFLSHKLSIVILNTLTVTKGNIGYRSEERRGG